MSKAIEGAAMLGTALAMGVAAFMDPALIASPLYDKIMAGLVLGGISMEAGALAGALTSNRGMNITTRQVAAMRQIIYGEQRVGGNIVYRSTTGSHHDQYNYIIVLAGHEIDSIVNVYLDGRQVFFEPGPGNSVRNGVSFGGPADGNDHIGPGGLHYNFGGLVYCEARFGDQLPGDVISGMTANDPNWAASSSGSPYLGGCAYVYLKVEYSPNMFPGEPEVRFTIRGKNDILDPRTGLAGYTNNWALIVADVLMDSQFGLGDPSVNTAQLIAAANVCDEMVPLAAGGEELRYTCNWHYDTATAPGDALQTMMPAAAGRLSRIGGEWYIWPAYWQVPSLSFGKGALTDALQWMPVKSLRDRFNRVTGTYIAPNYPYNDAGNLYDANGWYYGTIQDNFPFAFQPTNYPQYACDVLHGYASDQFLDDDDGIILPREIAQQCVLSVAQAQRVAKIMLLRNRQEGSGTFQMSLGAWQMQPCDVMQFTMTENGWTNKLLEINSVTLRVDTSGEAPTIRVELGVNETDPSVYAWNTAEELSVYNVPAAPPQQSYVPAAPANMTLESSSATALTGLDGVVRPRIEVEWDPPFDNLVTQIQVQYQPVGGSVWLDDGLVDVGNSLTYLSDVVSGSSYNVRIRSLRPSGAYSDWLEVDGYAVSMDVQSIATATPTQPGVVQLASGATSSTLSLVASTGRYSDLSNAPSVLVGVSASLGGSAMNAGQSVITTLTVPGAQVGYTVTATATDGSVVPDGFILSGAVTTNGNVSLKLYAITAGTPAAKNYNVRVSG